MASPSHYSVSGLIVGAAGHTYSDLTVGDELVVLGFQTASQIRSYLVSHGGGTVPWTEVVRLAVAANNRQVFIWRHTVTTGDVTSGVTVVVAEDGGDSNESSSYAVHIKPASGASIAFGGFGSFDNPNGPDQHCAASPGLDVPADAIVYAIGCLTATSTTTPNAAYTELSDPASTNNLLQYLQTEETPRADDRATWTSGASNRQGPSAMAYWVTSGGGEGTDVEETLTLAVEAGSVIAGLSGTFDTLSPSAEAGSSFSGTASASGSASFSAVGGLAITPVVAVQGALNLAVQVAVQVAAGVSASNALALAVQAALQLDDEAVQNIEESLIFACTAQNLFQGTAAAADALTLAVVKSALIAGQAAAQDAETLAAISGLDIAGKAAVADAVALAVRAVITYSAKAEAQEELTLSVVEALLFSSSTSLIAPDIIVMVAERLLKPYLDDQNFTHPQS